MSSIAFHPVKPYSVALSFVENLNFEKRAEIAGKSFMSSVLILNFED